MIFFLISDHTGNELIERFNMTQVNEMLSQEWTSLQNSHEQYEKGGLLVKLTGIALTAAGMAIGLKTAVVVALLLVLWGQEGIFRTFQSRIGKRLLRVEELIVRVGAADEGAPLSANANMPFQLHSEWLTGRKGVLGLLAEYVTNACKPTVAYPYALLVVMVMAKGWLV